MKVDLTKDQLKEINNIRKQSSVCKYFDNQKSTKFTVGDILIKKRYNYDEKWEVERINGNTGMPKRFVYVYEDEHGIGFVKSLKTTDGTLGKETICLADIDYSNTRFEVDPEYADQVLFGEENSFNIKEFHKKAKEKKKRIKQLNEASRFKTHKLSELNAFFAKLNVGDKFYTCDGSLGEYISEYKITKITKNYISRLNEDDKENLNSYANVLDLDDKVVDLDDKVVYRIEYANHWGPEETFSFDFFNDWIYSNKPLTVDDQVL